MPAGTSSRRARVESASAPAQRRDSLEQFAADSACRIFWGSASSEHWRAILPLDPGIHTSGKALSEPREKQHCHCGSALEVSNTSLHHPSVSKVEQMEAELSKLSQTELCQIREWLDDMIEDQLPFTPEFEHSIQQAERDMAEGKSARA
jgi:hypothetical protein